MSHPQPPAQPFSCLPSPLPASHPPYSPPGPLGVAAAEPNRYRAPSLTRTGTGRSRLPLPGGPLHPPSPRRDTTASHRRDAAAEPALLLSTSPSIVPLDPGADPRHDPAAAFPWLPSESPLPRPPGSPGGFQVGPCPCPHTRTHAQRPPNDRQGLEKGWGVFTVPRAASAGPDAAPGRSPQPSPPALPSLPGHPRPSAVGGRRPGGETEAR